MKLGPNKVTLEEVVHHLVTHPTHEKPRKLVYVKGSCNEALFEATAINDPDFSTKLDLFQIEGEPLTKLERQAITHRVKMALPTQEFDHRTEKKQKIYADLFDPICEKHYGKKIYFKVIYSRKDEAKKLGARWDADKKDWYLYSRSQGLEKMDQYFHRA